MGLLRVLSLLGLFPLRIAASEIELGLRISTFYFIMGISLGSIDFVVPPF